MTAPVGFHPYATVPKDGSLVLLHDDDVGTFPMRWSADDGNPLVSHGRGIWVLDGGGVTWCDEDPDGAPTWWRRPLGDA